MGKSLFKPIIWMSCAIILICLAAFGIYEFLQHRKLVQGEEIAKRDLKDPESATFRDVYLNEAKTKTGLETFLCGQMNARNGFGALSGFSRFVMSYKDHIAAIDPQVGITPEMVEAKLQECKNIEQTDETYKVYSCLDDAKNMGEKAGPQADFDDLWKSACEKNIPSQSGK